MPKKRAPIRRWLIENAAQTNLDPFALLIQHLRQDRHWTERAIAEAVTQAGGNGSQAVIHRLADGSRPVPADMATALALALGFGAGPKLARFIELVALANLLRGIERCERRSGRRNPVGKKVNLALRHRMAAVAKTLRR